MTTSNGGPAAARRREGFAAGVAAAAVLSTTAVFIRHLTEAYGTPALALAFWRDLLTFATILPVLALFRPQLIRITRPRAAYLAVYGVALAVFNSLWTVSVAWNGAAVATLLVYSSGAFTAVLARLFLKERIGAHKIAAIALSLAGCALVSGAADPAAWRSNLAGVAAGLLAGLSYAAYNLMGRSAAERGIGPWTSLLYIFPVAAALLLPACLLLGPSLPGAPRTPSGLLWLDGPPAGWLILFLLAAGPTVVGFGLYLVTLSRLPSSVANLVVALETVFVVLFARVFLGERVSAAQALGAAAIMASVVVLRMGERGDSSG